MLHSPSFTARTIAPARLLNGFQNGRAVALSRERLRHWRASLVVHSVDRPVPNNNMTNAPIASSIRDDADCLEMIARGGAARRAAVNWLYNEYQPRFRLYFLKNRVPEAEAEDVVQDTFVSIVRFIDKFRSESDVAVWLWKVARNCLIDHVRRSGRKPHLVDVDLMEAQATEASGQKNDPGGGLDECVGSAFQAFSERDPERASALRLVAIEGWSGKEIAEYLGRTPGAAREYLSQCRKFFKPFLAPCQDYLQA